MSPDPRRVGLVLILLVVSACSVTLRERAIRQVEAIDVLLSEVQDTEISLYESGAVPALTEARHRQFHAVLAGAFDAEWRVAIALRAWHPGQPVPPDLEGLVTAAREVLAVLDQIVPAGHRIWTLVGDWLALGVGLEQMLGGAR